ncbi:exopolysaccharide biosynthesis protein [Kineobactrum sediminis]|uniref:Exopolysaccharide biosynthesis protein n=1 Tax=Kineobactrum sediminis TaxID=1905677 RepID=A0A2N5XZE0_9GAMM|nr:exopolysaccharide biosynthesis protein [Kineobactrum sediminis]PLW81469.1 exopolysaccharide biosynthesis protein [Kineobactrum sediminis]
MEKDLDHEVKNLEELLDQLDRATETDHSRITVEEIVSAVGTRSFAPLLLLVGVLITSPLSGIPLFPTLSAIIVALVSAQMLAGRRHFWLPPWLLHRTVPRERMKSATRWLRPSARFIDHLLKPRLIFLVKGPATVVIAVFCLIIATGMPLLELIPFSSSLAGTALGIFGLSLVSRDGLLALIAYVTAGATLWLAIYGFSL